MYVLTTKKKKLFICEITTYIYVKGTSDTYVRFAQIALADVPRQTFLFKTEVVTSSPIYRFSEFSARGI